MGGLVFLVFVALCGYLFIVLIKVIFGTGKKQVIINQQAPQPAQQQVQQDDDSALYEAYALMLAYHLGLGEIYANFKKRYTHASTDSLLEMTTRGECEVYNIAGINYRGDLTNALGTNEAVLIPEPTNPHDPNAIRIELTDGTHVGYIPADQTAEAAKHLQAPTYAIIRRTQTYFFGQIYIKITE